MLDTFKRKVSSSSGSKNNPNSTYESTRPPGIDEVIPRLDERVKSSDELLQIRRIEDNPDEILEQARETVKDAWKLLNKGDQVPEQAQDNLRAAICYVTQNCHRVTRARDTEFMGLKINRSFATTVYNLFKQTEGLHRHVDAVTTAYSRIPKPPTRNSMLRISIPRQQKEICPYRLLVNLLLETIPDVPKNESVLDELKSFSEAMVPLPLLPALLLCPSHRADLKRIYKSSSVSEVVDARVHRAFGQIKEDVTVLLGRIVRSMDHKLAVLDLRGTEAQTFLNLTFKILVKRKSQTEKELAFDLAVRRLLVKLVENQEGGMLPSTMPEIPDLVLVPKPAVPGSFGLVRECSRKEADGTTRLYAVKSPKIQDHTPDEEKERFYQRACKEAILWETLRHTNVVEFIGINTTLFPNLGFSLVSRWMNKGHIMRYLQRPGVPARQIRLETLPLLLGVARGLAYLHSQRIVHRDLKGINILVDDTLPVPEACLTDFGLTSFSDPSTFSRQTSAPGSNQWMSPELLRLVREMASRASDDPVQDIIGELRDARFKSDVYAFALVCIELYIKGDPWTNVVWPGRDAVIEGKRPNNPFPIDMPWQLHDALEKWWASEIKNRPEMSEVVATLERILRDSRSSSEREVRPPQSEAPPPPQEKSRKTVSSSPSRKIPKLSKFFSRSQ